jgi:hypothetical protein
MLHSQLIQETGGSDGVRDEKTSGVCIVNTLSVFWRGGIVYKHTGEDCPVMLWTC